MPSNAKITPPGTVLDGLRCCVPPSHVPTPLPIADNLRSRRGDFYHLPMATFLFKTEPAEYPFGRLLDEKRAVWDGISNNAALAALRAARKNDQALIYHTGDEKAIVGLARIRTDAFEDPVNPGLDAQGRIRTPVVEIAPVRAAKSPVTLAQIKSHPRFKDFALVKQPRLSVMAVPPELDRILRDLAGLPAPA